LRSTAVGGILQPRSSEDRRLLEGLRDKGSPAQAGGKFARTGRGDERERDAALEQRGRDAEALAVGHVDVEQGEVETVAQVFARLGERVEGADHLVPLPLHDGLQVHRNEGVVLENENPHANAPKIPCMRPPQVTGARISTSLDAGMQRPNRL
jgi:hypothetical protein